MRKPKGCPVVPLLVAKELDIEKYRDSHGGQFMSEDELHKCAVKAYTAHVGADLLVHLATARAADKDVAA